MSNNNIHVMLRFAKAKEINQVLLLVGPHLVACYHYMVECGDPQAHPPMTHELGYQMIAWIQAESVAVRWSVGLDELPVQDRDVLFRIQVCSPACLERAATDANVRAIRL